ncbi:MAG TPA: amidohydrolase family protein [Vicinamibacterales bacterium]|nr:amidohydrolase family protein [Vicinamibacterales bacterium]
MTPHLTLAGMRLLAMSIAMFALTALPQPPPRSVLHFGHLWDGTRLMDDVVVVVEGDRITSVTDRQKTAPHDAVDLRRYTAIPGLIDLHTHITYYWDRKPGTRPLGQRRRPAVTVFLAQENARRTLETGVTTIRDLGASGDTDYAMRDLVAMGAMIGPRMFVAGQGISAGRGGTPDPATLGKAAEDRIKAGSNWVKVYASGGSFDSVDTTQTLTFDEMKAIVDAAHALGHKVAIHSYGASGVKDAVRAGADSVEHGIELDDETLADMVRRGTVWVPTIDHNRYYVDAKDEYGFKPEAIPPLQEYIAKNLESTRRAFRAGVKLGMGSDAVFSMFGQNTRELEWFVKAGMTPAQALATATTTAADLLDQKDRLGRIAPGFAADIVAIDGKPLDDISAVITGVRWVMKDGKVLIDRGRGPL